MPGPRTDPSGRSTARPLWLTALWSGIAPVVVGAVGAIVAVAICWLPASGASGNAGSAVRGGLLTFLAALHGGITVDGVATSFLPLGLLLLVGAITWRAGSALAAASDSAVDSDSDPGAGAGDGLRRSIRLGLLQLLAFAVGCALLAGVARLGTSGVSVPSAFVAGAVVFALFGGVAFVRGGALGDALVDRLPAAAPVVARIAAAITLVYLVAGAALVAGSLIVHHARVGQLTGQVGGGWSTLPVLLLALLAAPNAAIAGASYLAGPGFAVGADNAVALGTPAHGTVPAFPLLGALPSGPGGAPTLVWLLAVATPVGAGIVVAVIARRSPGWGARMGDAAAGVVAAAVVGALLAWQSGGGIGAGRLHSLGPSPLRFGLAVLGATALAAAVSLALSAGVDAVRGRQADTDLDTGFDTRTDDGVAGHETEDVTREPRTIDLLRAAFTAPEDDGKSDKLAG
ncbi:MAG TPA: DUF6350 family protein [Jatrophihabitans sp.]|jgi:hypothetical protein|uniref:cell division protein PerM n=1 Tax=Jatrophihabitans sp. TaxID=1932789 RepID=UPI002DFCF88D|nr:DUF6350 family protein [Jatrophihabitans sp.]